MFRFVKIDDELLAKAKEFTGIEGTSEILHDSLRCLIRRKRTTRQMAERFKNGPRPTVEEYLKSIEKFPTD